VMSIDRSRLDDRVGRLARAPSFVARAVLDGRVDVVVVDGVGDGDDWGEDANARVVVVEFDVVVGDARARKRLARIVREHAAFDDDARDAGEPGATRGEGDSSRATRTDGDE